MSELELTASGFTGLPARKMDRKEITIKDIGNRVMCSNEDALQATESILACITSPFMAGAAEVEVDTETGNVELLRFAAVDCGTLTSIWQGCRPRAACPGNLRPCTRM